MRALAALGLAALLSCPAAAGAAPSRSAKIGGFARNWLGTRYQWGGTSRAGIDCSAYLRQMYRDLFGIELPRTTRQQIRLGRDITVNPRRLSDKLAPGDLIFYVDGFGTPSHVVIYAGAGKITHSVSGRGVVIDPIRRVYGRRIVARRLLIPRRGGGGGPAGGAFLPVPPAGPVVSQEIPCPPSTPVKRAELRRFSRRAILPDDFKKLGPRSICAFKALAGQLSAADTPIAKKNAAVLEQHAAWLDSIEALTGQLGGAPSEGGAW